MILQEPIQATVWHCLNHYQFSDAVFLSERLHAEVKTDDTLFLLATAYYRSGQIDHAYHLLKDECNNSPRCRYLFGKCAFEKERYAEVETILLDNCNGKSKCLDDIVSEFGDEAAFVLALLAETAIKTERRVKAAEALKKALKLNPFLWSCYTELCNLGEKPNPNDVFKLTELENLSTCYGSCIKNLETLITPAATHLNNTPSSDSISYMTPPQQIMNNGGKFCTLEESPLANPLLMSGCNFLPSSRIKPLKYRMLNSFVSSPSFGLFPLDSSDVVGTPLLSQSTLTESNDQHRSLAKKMRAHMGQLINRKETPLQNNKPVFSQSSNTNAISVTPSTPASITNLQPIQNVRRSSRLFSNCSVKENNKSPNRTKFAVPRSPSKKTKQRITKCNLNKTSTFAENTKNRLEKEKSETITSTELKNNYSAILNPIQSNPNCAQQLIEIQKQSAEGLMCLLRRMGKAYLNLSQFNCKMAIEELSSLPLNHFETACVYSMLGLAYFEMADYENCVKYFSEIRNQEPHSLKYMDIYSTALWHLQREVALSALAQDLVNVDKNSPVTWCVNGNCFSLHKEHDTAIKFFQRAVQVDPSFAYAYTLLGHEYIMTDELDKAMSCFRNAIRINPRHYNAWFGIGTIYSKQERYHLAEINYSRALAINPNSSVLMCHLGIVQNALKKTEKAINTLNLAISKDSKNPLCKFHRGSIYFSIGRHAEALKELEELKEIVPKESLVYYLIGKVHKKLGNTDLALMHFSWATDLDPKGGNSQIKEGLDPSFGRSTADMESSPMRDEFQSESNSVQQDQFFDLPEESDDSL